MEVKVENTIYTVMDLNCNIVEQIDHVVMYFRQQNYDRGLRKFYVIIGDIERLLTLYSGTIVELSAYTEEVNQNQLLGILPTVIEAQENRDYTLMADLLELQLRKYIIQLQAVVMYECNEIPSTYRLQRNMQAIQHSFQDLYSELNTKMEQTHVNADEYESEFTVSGFVTLKCNKDDKTFYMHSNNNPQAEAMTLASTWYSEEKNRYVVYGLGLGYHIKQLCECNQYIQVEVYEDSIDVIRLAAMYGDLAGWINKGQAQIHWDPNYTQFAKEIENADQSTEVVIYAPSLKMVRNRRIQAKMEEYFLHYNSVKNQRGIMLGNFRYNTTRYDESVDVLLPKWRGRDVYIIAAGPSLDSNYEELCNVGNNGIILATATVYRKLVKAGIRPDYFIVTDPNARIIGQLEGVEQETIPMLLLTTAFEGFSRICKGTKYLVCQKDFTCSEEFAKEHGYQLYNSGGSVMTAALDVAIQLQAKRIIFVGLDLAYPNNLVHAEGTSRRNLHEDRDLLETKDIYGKLVKTNKHLDMYRRWIEERIQETKEITFLDATEGGARVKGTVICKLSEIVNEYDNKKEN